MKLVVGKRNNKYIMINLKLGILRHDFLFLFFVIFSFKKFITSLLKFLKVY